MTKEMMHNFLKLSIWNIISNSFILFVCTIFDEEIMVTSLIIILCSILLLLLSFPPSDRQIILPLSFCYPIINIFFVASDDRRIGVGVDEYILWKLFMNEIICIIFILLQRLFTYDLIRRQQQEARVAGCPGH